jgi:hypothetical protein
MIYNADEQIPLLLDKCILVLQRDSTNWMDDSRAKPVRDAISNLCYSPRCCAGAEDAAYQFRKEVLTLAEKLDVNCTLVQ